MKLLLVGFFVCISSYTSVAYAIDEYEYIPPGGAKLPVEINGTDTLLLSTLQDVYIFPRNNFKNKAQEKFFWKTVRDVKKTLPYAKLVSNELYSTNLKLAKMSNDSERKKYLSTYEKDIFKKYEADLKKMTVSQGQMLMKLIDRECDQSSYDLIKAYKGNFSAIFWQGVAKIFGSDLKVNYNPENKDKIIERVIVLVEAGQL